MTKVVTLKLLEDMNEDYVLTVRRGSTQLYGDLLVQCMMAEISGTPLTGIIRFFNETENEIRYHL